MLNYGWKPTTRNMRFPGRENYLGPIEGPFGLLHHGKLFEYSKDVRERVVYVRCEKPVDQIPKRLHNMIYLGDCDAARLFPYNAPAYARKLARARVLRYIRKHIPDCAWERGRLRFLSVPA